MENKNTSLFDPKAFLGAKVISPLEQEKLLGGTAAPVVVVVEEEEEVVEVVVEIEES